MKLLTDYLKVGSIYFRERVLESGEIKCGIKEVADYLSDNINSKSPFIYLFAKNHFKTPLALFGIIKSHRICIVVDPNIGKIELSEMMQNTPPAACIKIDTNSVQWNFNKEIQIEPPSYEEFDLEELNDVCLMIYTAADDGHAKAAMLTHENLFLNGQSLVELNCINNESVSCALLHFNHLFGIQTGIITPFVNNGSLVIEIIDNLINIPSIINDLSAYKVTNLYSVPFVYYLISKNKSIRMDQLKITSCVSGGYKLSPKIYQLFKNRCGKEIHEGYGLSEASPICSWHRRDDPIKIDSVGRAFPCCEIKIFNEKMEELTPGSEGEICIRGKNIMKGYYKNSEATKKVLADGWLRSGDKGYLDNEGFVYLTGLYKKMLNYGGQKVYIKELERLLKLNKNVEEVEVFGIQDWLVGQKVCANIKLYKNNPQEIDNFTRWCRVNLSPSKIPSKINFK